MASWDDVREIGLGLPETLETESREGNRVLTVGGKGFVWERPLRRGDLAALGDAAPDGPVLCAHVPDVGAKEALIADDPATFFTTPHFNGFPAVLVRLDVITLDDLREVTVEAWLAKAPKRLAKTYLDGAG